MSDTVLDPATFIDNLDHEATHHTTACGDGTMVWRSWGQGTPLVLLHGGSGSWRHWARNIRHFARNRMVLCPDTPGLGQSDSPPPPSDPHTIARVMAEGADSLLGGVRYDLVGFSFGATIAGHIAAQRGEQVTSLTLVGAAALGTPRAPVNLVRVRDKTGAERVAANRHNLAALMIADPARIDDLALEIQDRNTRETRYVSRAYAPSAILRDAVAQSTARLCAIWGELDAVSLDNLPGRIGVLRALRPDADIRTIPGMGHWVAYEAAPQFNAMLDDMLAS